MKFNIAVGTVTVLLANIHSSDLLKTAILAGVGAAVSFVMTRLLNRLTGRKRKST